MLCFHYGFDIIQQVFFPPRQFLKFKSFMIPKHNTNIIILLLSNGSSPRTSPSLQSKTPYSSIQNTILFIQTSHSKIVTSLGSPFVLHHLSRRDTTHALHEPADIAHTTIRTWPRHTAHATWHDIREEANYLALLRVVLLFKLTTRT